MAAAQAQATFAASISQAMSLQRMVAGDSTQKLVPLPAGLDQAGMDPLLDDGLFGLLTRGPMRSGLDHASESATAMGVDRAAVQLAANAQGAGFSRGKCAAQSIAQHSCQQTPVQKQAQQRTFPCLLGRDGVPPATSPADAGMRSAAGCYAEDVHFAAALAAAKLPLREIAQVARSPLMEAACLEASRGSSVDSTASRSTTTGGGAGAGTSTEMQWQASVLDGAGVSPLSNGLPLSLPSMMDCAPPLCMTGNIPVRTQADTLRASCASPLSGGLPPSLSSPMDSASLLSVAGNLPGCSQANWLRCDGMSPLSDGNHSSLSSPMTSASLLRMTGNVPTRSQASGLRADGASTPFDGLCSSLPSPMDSTSLVSMNRGLPCRNQAIGFGAEVAAPLSDGNYSPPSSPMDSASLLRVTGIPSRSQANGLGVCGAPPLPGGRYPSRSSPVDSGAHLPMQVSMPGCHTPATPATPAVFASAAEVPEAPAVPYPTFARGKVPQAPESPITPPPGLEESSLADALRRHIALLVSKSFAERGFGPANTTPSQFGARGAPAGLVASPDCMMPDDMHCRVASLATWAVAKHGQAADFGTAPEGRASDVPVHSSIGWNPANTLAIPARTLQLPKEHFRPDPAAAPAAACGSPPAEASPAQQPKGRVRRGVAVARGSPASEASPVTADGGSTPGGASPKERRFTCTYVFGGFDLEGHADFELVPRLIGRGGANMREIAKACDGKVRIRGRGSGHHEQRKGQRASEEADVPLQIALSCKERGHFEEGQKRLASLLKFISAHFERYCRKKGIVPVPVLYSVVGSE